MLAPVPELNENVIREPMFSQKRGVVPAGKSLPMSVLKARIAPASGLPSLIIDTRLEPTKAVGGPLMNPTCPGKTARYPATAVFVDREVVHLQEVERFPGKRQDASARAKQCR